MPYMDYSDLINDLRDIVDTGLLDRTQYNNLGITYTNWEIGKRLITIEQGGLERASYGKKIVERVSNDLQKVYGRGFGPSTLQSMRQFYQVYKKSQIDNQLTWSHYLSLIRVRDLDKRKLLEQRAIKSNWSPRELAYQSRLKKTHAYKRETNLLKRPGGKLGVLQIKQVIESGERINFIDLGFEFWIQIRDIKSDTWSNKQLVVNSGAGFKLQLGAYNGELEDMWLYRASLDRVIDGDSIIVFIELGFDTRCRQRLRLRSVNASALTDPRGIKARGFIKKQLQKASYLILKTGQQDKYARYVADVLIALEGQSVEDCLENGLFLNQELLNRNLAVLAQ